MGGINSPWLDSYVGWWRMINREAPPRNALCRRCPAPHMAGDLRAGYGGLADFELEIDSGLPPGPEERLAGGMEICAH